jgi:hypothetical protein
VLRATMDISARAISLPDIDAWDRRTAGRAAWRSRLVPLASRAEQQQCDEQQHRSSSDPLGVDTYAPNPAALTSPIQGGNGMACPIHSGDLEENPRPGKNDRTYFEGHGHWRFRALTNVLPAGL